MEHGLLPAEPIAVRRVKLLSWLAKLRMALEVRGRFTQELQHLQNLAFALHRNATQASSGCVWGGRDGQQRHRDHATWALPRKLGTLAGKSGQRWALPPTLSSVSL